MIPGTTAEQVEPHIWHSSSSLSGSGLIASRVTNFLVTARFAGSGAFVSNAKLRMMAVTPFVGFSSIPVDSTMTGTQSIVVNLSSVSSITTQSQLALKAGGSFIGAGLFTKSAMLNVAGVSYFSALSGFGPLWLPSDLGASLAGWWDASDASTITNVSGKCSQWNDKSSNANNMTQATAGSRPTITASGLGGLTVLTCAGSQFMTNAAVTGLPDLTTGVGFAVAGYQAGNDGTYLETSDTGANDRTALLFLQSTVMKTQSRLANAGTINYADTVNPHLITGLCKTNFRGVNKDGVAGTNNTTSQTNLSSSQLQFFKKFSSGGFALFGYVGEIVITSDLTSTQQELLEGYLAWKWGLQGNLDAGHAYKAAPPRSGPNGTIV